MLLVWTSESSLASDARLSAYAEARSNNSTEGWENAVSHQHLLFSLSVALIVAAGDSISGHNTLRLVLSVKLAKSSSASRISNRAVTWNTKSNMASASGNCFLSAPRIFTVNALNGLDLVFLDLATAPARLTETWALVTELMEPRLLPFFRLSSNSRLLSNLINHDHRGRCHHHNSKN